MEREGERHRVRETSASKLNALFHGSEFRKTYFGWKEGSATRRVSSRSEMTVRSAAPLHVEVVGLSRTIILTPNDKFNSADFDISSVPFSRLVLYIALAANIGLDQPVDSSAPSLRSSWSQSAG